MDMDQGLNCPETTELICRGLLDEELGRERCQQASGENTSPNYRNGYSRKTVKTQLGEIDIKVPRDRQGNYEPKIIGKYDRNADGMEDKILSLYACGMSQRDIAEQIRSLYDVEISPELVTKICEKTMPEVTAWHASPQASICTCQGAIAALYGSIIANCIFPFQRLARGHGMFIFSDVCL